MSFFAENPSLKSLVAEQENLLIGNATFIKQFSTWDAHFYIYLDCLYLKEHTREKGLEKMIIQKIKEYCKSQNCTIAP
ncbi:GNAT family N-acetyltransferase [Flavobacterium ovatum]|uniref:GNAT family N-acetyltransferase n=1 Tax=Flavobacterium ovatum TaxID=1928857 RepID=UPI00344B6600